ncbi:hypothetical protein [Paenibacillus sp. UNC451MF]|uniref:hypothetical protein n=1 Tax=Paenibacillus sp. UNC451MF TaxID=1449063 RepID=UPI000AEB452F|nr:hypothetical protein [Paenibacillus sp. UNC451MF]
MKMKLKLVVHILDEFRGLSLANELVEVTGNYSLIYNYDAAAGTISAAALY